MLPLQQYVVNLLYALVFVFGVNSFNCAAVLLNYKGLLDIRSCAGNIWTTKSNSDVGQRCNCRHFLRSVF